jgi:proteasome component ECM29
MKFSMLDDLPQPSLERFLICTVCSVDSFNQVQSVAQEGLRRYPAPDYENEELIKKLFRLYQGIPAPKLQLEASPALKQKLLAVLAKSKLATNTLPQMVQVSFDALYGPQTSLKLRQAGMSFVQAILRNAELQALMPVAPVFLSGLLKLIKERDLDEAVRGFAYEACAILSRRVPSLFENDITLLEEFFNALSTEPRYSILTPEM